MELIYKLIQDRDWTEQEGKYKLYEEVEEFRDALYSNNKADILEEGFDVIQSVISLIDMKGLTTDEIYEGLKVHNEKLENRGWDRTAIFEVKEVK